MKKEKIDILQLLLSKRTDFIKLILATFILALGVNLLSTHIYDLFKPTSNDAGIIGVILVAIVLLLFAYSILIENKNEITINSIITFDNKKKTIFPILRYEFSDALHKTINAVCLENEAIKKNWEEDFKLQEEDDAEEVVTSEINLTTDKEMKEKPIGYFSIVRVKEEHNNEKSKSHIILEEVLEYIILEQLSLHLSTYFNDYDDQDKLIKEYTRNDFPEILLQNRIINLLSTPFEDRPIFIKAGMTVGPNEEIFTIYGDDGSIFNRFDLVLPTGSKVKRPKAGSLIVENNRIILEIDINYKGFGGSLPKGFEYNYLGNNDDNTIDTRSLKISLNYRVKPLGIFYSSKWDYHNWIDSFADRLIEFASFKDFIKRINWDSSLTNIVVMNQREKFKSESKNKEKTNG